MSTDDESRAADGGGERLAKVIAHTGVASRRAAERMVEEGRVTVNGETVYHPGHPVLKGADVRVDGKPLPRPPPLAYFLLYKPRGVLTTREDPDGRRTVMEFIDALPIRVEPVGRLDMDTEGALLLTNDGELAHKLTHPSTNVPKRYAVKVWKRPHPKQLERIKRGLQLDDGRTKPALVRPMETTDTGNTWFEVTVTEGRNRLVRRLFETIGHPVSKLRRESFATLSIRGMERGDVRPLTGEEVRRIQEIAEGRDPREAGHGTRYKKGYARPKAQKTIKPGYKRKRVVRGPGGSKGPPKP